MQRLLIFFLMLLANLAIAETAYKSVDEHGNVIFSDQPIKDAEKIEIKKAPTIPAFTIPAFLEPGNKPTKKTTEVYQSLLIKHPTHEQTINNNLGNLGVTISLVPGLQTGHMFQLEMDGTEVDRGTVAQFDLQNIDRGEHTLVILVIDAEGNTLLTSKPVTFFMRRVSQLHPHAHKNKNNIANPKTKPNDIPGSLTPTAPQSLF